MAGNVINLIRRDFYALWAINRGPGVFIFLSLIFISPVAPVWRFFTLIFLPFVIQLYSNSAFSLEEKYRTDRYFASLPVRRDEIVRSRYFGAVVLLVFHFALAYSGNLAFNLAGSARFQLLPGYFALAVLFVSLLTSISFPFYFKFGATKAMHGLTAGLMGIFYGAIFIVGKRPDLFSKIRNFSLTDAFYTSLLLTGMAILMFVVSIRISTAIYNRKDL